MDTEKVLALLQIESLSRLHPKLAAITTEAMNQLTEVAKDLGGKPKSLQPAGQFANVRPTSTVAPAERDPAAEPATEIISDSEPQALTNPTIDRRAE